MNRLKTRVTIGVAVAIAAGLTAVADGPARATMDALMSCAQSAPCLEWDNTKSGDAIKGVSSKGNALHGQTKYNSTGKTSGKAGVLGEDLSTSGNLDAGVSGVSTNGPGVMGTSSSWNAVEGLSSNSTGVYGQTGAAGGYGAAGRNVSSTAGGGAGVLGDGGQSNVGVFGTSNSGQGIYAYSESGTSLLLFQGSSNISDELVLQGNGPIHRMILATDTTGRDLFSLNSDGSMQVSSSGNGSVIANAAGNFENSALNVVGGGVGTGNDVISVFDANGNAAMDVTDNGDVTITGQLVTGGSCQVGCLVGKHRTHSVTEYAPTESRPTIEDFGEGTLVEGRADIALDTKFANVIDPHAPYSVWVTPEGDCRGLFVAGKTPAGFSVHELQGGHASIAFQYRIVASRYGASSARLPMTAVRKAPSYLHTAGK